jgi:uncharacterized membrane protein
MQDFSFMTTEEHFLLQDALKKNKKQVIKFLFIGLALMVLAVVIPQLFMRNSTAEETEQSMFSYKNGWFWIWLLSFIVALIFALIKVTEVRYFTIRKDLIKLQKGLINAPLEAVYHENNDTQTNFMVQIPDTKRKRLFYWMRGSLNDYRVGNEVEISYARYSRVILAINKK